jgi:hypothetical protein
MGWNAQKTIFPLMEALKDTAAQLRLQYLPRAALQPMHILLRNKYGKFGRNGEKNHK